MIKWCRPGLLLLTLVISNCLPGQKKFFAATNEPNLSIQAGKRVIIPDVYKTLELDTRGMEIFLRSLPLENSLLHKTQAPILELPLPYGGTAKYNVWESPVMEPALAIKYPGIKTYTGQGIDDPTATIKIDMTELGFHAMILSDISGPIFIDPYNQTDTRNYIVYFKKDFRNREPLFKEILIPAQHPERTLTTNRPGAGPCVGPQLRSFRLAVACTGEYARAATGRNNPTVAQAMSAIVTSINRVDGVYERELAVSLNLVATNDAVVFVNPDTDPFTANNDGSTLLDESQTVINQYVGFSNYDIGHTFSTGGGGIAQVGSACSAAKARGVTGLTEPYGDPYDIDYVAHELGHQLGANHSFNAVSGSCSGNRNEDSAAEPGGGVTIMSYAGICGAVNDLAINSMPYFHAISFDEITTFITTGNGAACASISNTGNTAPVVSALSNYTIPKSTSFVLTGNATDLNGDVLTYSWEEVDLGPAGNWNAPSGNAPIFRSFAPVTTPVRYFPRLADQVRNTSSNGELLPSYSRDMHFRLTARDNKAGGGGVCYKENSMKVDGNSGPFIVTAPAGTGISWEAGTVQTITWDVANTDQAPVNCNNVTIQLSLDSGYTFPVTILANTPNDGNQQIIVPDNVTSQARIRVMAVGNVFYDMSDHIFAITPQLTGFNFIIPAARQVNCADPNSTSASITLATESVLGYSAPINLTASGNPPGTTVSFSASVINPGESTVVTLNNIHTLANGTYIVTIKGESGSLIREQELTFIVEPGTAPGISSQPEPVKLCENASALFNVTSASPVIGYQWQVSTNGGANFADISDATAATLSVPNVATGLDNNRYRVLVKGQCNVTISNAVPLTVHTLPVVGLTASPLISLTPGLTTTLTATPSASSGGIVTLTWFKDQMVIPVTGTTLQVDVTTLGDYKVRIEESWADGNTCASESPVVTIAAATSGQLFIYPSPNNGRFTVSYFNSAAGNTRQSVTLYDAKGAKVFSKMFSFTGSYKLHDIDVRGLTRGLYFIVIGDANGKKITDGKVLIN